MDRYITVMIVPEREKGVHSFRIPRPFFRALLFFAVAFLTLLVILGYDYVKILRHVYENKHLMIENRQLKEQIQLNQMKINTLTEDLERINIFEKKLRVITGLNATTNGQENSDEKINPTDLAPADQDLKQMEQLPDRQESGEQSLLIPRQKMIDELTQKVAAVSRAPDSIPNKKGRSLLDVTEAKQKEKELNEEVAEEYKKSWPRLPQIKKMFENFNDEELLEDKENYQKLKKLYEKKIAASFGLYEGYNITKEWSELTKQSLEMAKSFARFDYQFSMIKNVVKELELDIHKLDQYLLDQESFLKSTPTLLPTKGWITSYYGPRQSHYSNRVKMHEGIDIGAQNGTPIVAPADGIVTYAGPKPGFGLFVLLDHGYGVETAFAHAQSISVKKGDVIGRGQKMASVGSTGYSTGPHVHYEVRVNGTPVDPLYYILD